ncbi:alcohol dehydrogenase catalytic domain-containing protein [Streptomyces cacaoi]|uniref:alcohol dehydrogenase catalytic domain-containing protein n=1 Tax=Streptomyces cacaoi TaxID=1898 RepID=UPI0037497D91
MSERPLSPIVPDDQFNAAHTQPVSRTHAKEEPLMPETMTALFGGTGPDWAVRQAPVPQPGPGQIVVRARAAALNNADASMLAAADPTSGGTGKEYRAGYEFAGEVAAVGDGVGAPVVGERVMGTTPGSFAQYVLADHRHVLPVPDELAHEEACALPTGLLTEHGALMTAGFRAGQPVLITGATCPAPPG